MLLYRASLIFMYLNSYDSVPLARAMLRGSFSDSSQASTAPIVRELTTGLHSTLEVRKTNILTSSDLLVAASKLSHVLSPSSSPNAHSSNQRRLSIDSARSVSPEWENSIPSPGIPLLEWIARQTAREEAERRIAEQRGSVEAEEEDDEMEDGDRYDLDRRSPGTPTVDDALMYFARPDAPPARPTITLSASSAAVYGSTHSATTKSPTHRSSRSPETGSSYSATGRLYHPPSSKPFKCPTEGCDKAYKQQNGLKYHLKHGKCSNDPEVLAKEGDPTSGDKKRFACHSEECNKKYKK